MPEPTAKARGSSAATIASRSGLRTTSTLIAAAAMVIAVIAVAVAVWAVLRPPSASTATSSTATSFTAQQTADAKARACSAFATVRSAVSLQTHRDLGSDPVAIETVAANARLAMAAGGAYLLGHLDPATPPPLAGVMRSFANDLQDISMNTLAGASNDDPSQAARLHDGDVASMQVTDSCK